MKQIHGDNPFGAIPKGAVWEALNALGIRGRHLDYGTYDGEALLQFKKTGLIDTGVGLDLNKKVIEENIDRMLDGITLKVIRKGDPLSLENESFDTASAIGVIEHIADQKSILRELHRVLRPRGHLLIAVPGKHFFSFLDMGNYKFVFPRLHKAVYPICYSKEEYHQRYVECSNGMFGDIETGKMWHQHFSVHEMIDLVGGCGFELVDHDGLGFFQRVIDDLGFFMPRFIKPFFQAVHALDAKTFSSAELCFVARKI